MTTSQPPGGEPLTLPQARNTALELVAEALALVPESVRAAADQQPPRPGEVARTLVPGDVLDGPQNRSESEGARSYHYPGGGSVTVLPGNDVHRLATEIIDELAQRPGWSAQQRSQPSAHLSDQRILTAPGGYAVSVLPMRAETQQPFIRVSVLSPGFTPPVDFSPHRKY